MKPMQAALPKGQTLIYTEPTEALMLYLKMALLVGILIASPGVMTQVWLFVAPGLYANEKKLAIPFVLMSSFFFIAGAVFSHYVVFPLTWQFFQSFSSDPVVHAAHRARIRPLREADADLRPHLPDADAGPVPGPDGH